MTDPSPAEPAATLTIAQYPEALAVVRLAPGAEIPAWAESSSVFSITATAGETSLICAGRNVPTKARSHKPLIGFAIRGTLPPARAGVLIELLRPLAEAEIEVLTASTHDTEWLLVHKNHADRAAEAWRRRGHTVAPAVPVPPVQASQAEGKKR